MKSRFTIHDSRFTFGIVAVALTVVYVATMAPDVTLWDAGEYNAAIASVGIPHPAGTPLYILIGRVWALIFWFVPQALAINLLSAVATAISCGLLAGLIARWMNSDGRVTSHESLVTGVAAGITAGTMLAVWQNATETEVYALSMLLSVVMVAVGDRAGSRDSTRWRLLLGFLMALAVPLQISALVAAPAAILLAAMTPGRRLPDPRHLWSLGSTFVVVTGAGLVDPVLVAGGVASFAFSFVRYRDARVELAQLGGLSVLGLSAALFMLVRAMHDPFINQGNPATIGAFLDHLARNQYPLPGLWPRRAPVWVQLVSLVQYGDWQVASGLDENVAASFRRTPWSIAAVLLAVVGWRWLRRSNERGATAAMVLFLTASLGVVGVLNHAAGPSISDAVLPPGTSHEPRERDYFFALAFAVAGTWAGAGAVVAARRWFGTRPLATGAALGLAGLPLLLNWTAANRRPNADVAPVLGEALLASVPERAMFLVGGDNDSYTVWYRQAVFGERPDVVPVTISLLGAPWYRAELARRHQLFEPSASGAPPWLGEEATLQALVAAAVRQGRPVAASVTVRPSLRQRLAPAWTLGGLAYVAASGAPTRSDVVDTSVTRRVADLISARVRREPHSGRDPAIAYFTRLLGCPAAVVGSAGSRAESRVTSDESRGLLDSRCNFK